MLTITRRDARIGRNIPFRTEEHGDEPVRATDIPIESLLLDARELGELLAEPRAHQLLFVQREGSSKLSDPIFKQLAPFKLSAKIESAQVSLYFGVGEKELKLGTCKLKGVTLEPQTGGLTAMSCTVQATPTLDRRIAELIDHMGDTVRIEIGYERNAEQGELLNGAEEGEGSDEPAPRSRRRKPQADRPAAH